MTRRSAQLRRLTLAATCVLIAAAAPSAAVTIDFEPPTYTTGNLIGQDGWIKNAYYGDLNGTVTVSNVSPLAGTQSLSYAQTVAGGFSDISKNDAILIAPGVQGTDLTVSYVIKATTNSLGGPIGGIFLGPGTAGGGSPIFGRINGGVFEVGASLGIDSVNEFFFSEGERLKVTYEVDFDTSNMNLILENLDFGEIYSETFPFFAGYGSPSGPNGEFVVDVGVFLRGGNVQIDDIMLTAGVGPLVTDFTWNAGSGNWNQTTNWDPPGLPGTVAGRQHATLGAAEGPTTIYNNSDRILNSLEIDSAQPYFITGTGSLGFQVDASGPTPVEPSINVAAGSHQIQVPIELSDDTAITVAGGGALDLNNQINLNGNTLDLSGTVRINHSTVGSGAVTSSGALAANGAVSISGNLVSSGELLVAVDADGADVFNVAGDATLSGIVNVDWTPGSVAAGTVAIVTAGGTLDAARLSLAPEDARSFALGTEGNTLTLTFLGAAVPEPAGIALLALGVAGVALQRRSRPHAMTSLAAAAALLLTLTPTRSASAIGLDFEPPTYTAGAIQGQDGWDTNAYVLADPFFGGVVNGEVTVSTSNPLAGSQSLLYNQLVDPSAAGVTGASDAGKAGAVSAKKHGSTAIDLTASLLLRTDLNSVGSGSAGYFLGKGGASPVFLRIDNANSGLGTGSIVVGDGAGVPTVASYVPNKTYQFDIGVDLDNLNYEVSMRNITDNGPAVPLTGGGPGGRFVFFTGLPNPVWADDGDGQTFTFDSSVILRSGMAQVDNIELQAIPEPSACVLILMATGTVALARRRPRKVLVTGLTLLIAAGMASSASAVLFNFENPPYTPGTLQGQDGWATNGYVLLDPFFGGVVNGTVEISSSSPLSGSQSVLYNQTVDPPTAGVSGASDVGRPNSVFAVKDGTTAVDITASVRVRTDENGVGTGSMGFFLGRGGASPIFFRIDNASTAGATGSILVGDGAAVPVVGSYLPNKTYEFTFGVDVDNLNYTLSSRNVTDNTAPVNYAGSGPDGRFVYFTGLPTPTWADDGDGQTFTFDSSLIFRSGVGRADDITLVGDDFTEAQWGGGSGSWSDSNLWIPRIAPNVPASNAPIAVFGSRITSPQTVFTNASQTVNGLRFDNANTYVIGGGGTVALKANTIGGTVNPTINVIEGAHELQAAVNVLNNTTVTVEPGAQLDFNNTVSLGGRTLATSGAVNLNVGVTGGGAINNSGTLGTAGTTPIAANLTSTGTLAIDLGPTNTDFFNITGSATLSGLLDVTLEPGFTPVGSYTVLTASGGLNAAGLALHSSDTSAFTLGVSGNSLVLTVGGTTSIPGDFDGDGTVDSADLAQWKGDFGENSNSDADGDMDSDGRDLLIWQRNLGQSNAAPAAAAVPEPGAAVLVATSLLALTAFGQARRRQLPTS